MRWGLMFLAICVLLFVTVQGVRTNKDEKKVKQQKQTEKMWAEETNSLIDHKSGLPRFIQQIVMPR